MRVGETSGSESTGPREMEALKRENFCSPEFPKCSSMWIGGDVSCVCSWLENHGTGEELGCTWTRGQKAGSCSSKLCRSPWGGPSFCFSFSVWNDVATLNSVVLRVRGLQHIASYVESEPVRAWNIFLCMCTLKQHIIQFVYFWTPYKIETHSVLWWLVPFANHPV